MVLARDPGHIGAAGVNAFATLEQDGSHALLNQPQGCKQSGRSGPYHHRLRHIVGKAAVCLGLQQRRSRWHRLINPDTQSQIDEHPLLTGVDRATEHLNAADFFGRHTQFAGTHQCELFLIGRRSGVDTQLQFLFHWC